MKHLLLSIALLFTINLAFAQVPNYVPTTNLIGWWPFSGNANDRSGHGNHGNVTGAQLAADRFGVLNSSYVFDGVNDYITVPPTGVTSVRNHSVSAWLNYTGAPGTYTYNTYFQFGDRDISGNGHSFGYAYDYGTIAFNLYQRCKPTTTPASNIKNGWHHVVVVNQLNVQKLYIDGVMKDSVYTVDTLCYQGSNTLWFGASPTADQYVQGNIDDIGFWDRALTAKEVMQLYTGLPSAVNEPSHQAPITLFPNPAKVLLTIRNAQPGASYVVRDAVGKSIAAGKLDAKNAIDVSSLSNGFYLLTIETTGSQKSFKFTKE